LFGVIVRVAEKDVIALGLGGVEDAAGHFGEKGVRDVAEDETQGVGALGDEGASDFARPVAELLYCCQHPPAGLVRDLSLLVHHARDGLDRDARCPGDITHGCGHLSPTSIGTNRQKPGWIGR
jgi:hypothetical protein